MKRPSQHGIPRVAAVVAGILFLPSLARAVERYVPIGYPTIQSAIDAAEPGDEVVLAEGTYTGPGNRNLDYGGKAITVRSTNPNDLNVVAATIIDAAHRGNGFNFRSAEEANSVVAGLTITNGRADSGGGAIYCESSSPTIMHCLIRGNSADGPGGGIYCSGGSPAISRCTISGNSTDFNGGGIYCAGGSPTITYSTISGNSADGHGAGIYGAGGSPTIVNCTIHGNSTDGSGGGISCSEANPTIANCTVTANATDQDGGGINCAGGSVTVANCVVWGNAGGGIAGDGVTVSFSDVEGGYTGDGNLDADPIFVDPGGPDDDASTWQDNDYHLGPNSPCNDAADPNGDYAGQTDIDGEPRRMGPQVDIGSDEYSLPTVYNLTQSTYHETIQAAIDLANEGDEIVLGQGRYTGDGNRCLDYAGKAIIVRSSNPYVADAVAATIVDLGQAGRGFYFHNGESPNSVVTGLTITNGLSDTGGAIYCSQSDPRIANCIISDNSAWFAGGGIACGYGSNPMIDSCTINSNSGSFGGGGICCAYNSAPAIANCIIQGNTTDNYGGGIICFDSADPTVTNCTLSANSSAFCGGGIGIIAAAPVLVSCVFKQNTAADFGGGLYQDGNSVVFNCVFLSNEAPRGGGVCTLEKGGTLVNCLLSGNTTTDDGGGVFNDSAGDLILLNCTFSGNSGAGSGSGGGLCNSRGLTSLTNCIFWGNTYNDLRTEGTQIANFGGEIAVKFSCVDGWSGRYGGIGNIGYDPLFVDADGPDNSVGTEDDSLQLLCRSPCIDVADNAALPEDSLDLDGDGDCSEPIPYDLGGDPRVLEGTVDMGAYEGANQGFIVLGDPLVVSEGGVATFAVTLACFPLGPVNVTVAQVEGDQDITVQLGATLHFDLTNFEIPQQVTLAAAEDVDQINGSATIEISANGIAAAHVVAIESDNDGPFEGVLVVHPNAPPGGNGFTWDTALPDLQDALNCASDPNNTVTEIWVAAGTYRPSRRTDPQDARTATYQLLNGVAVYGGFTGGEGGRHQRDPTVHASVLSGDLNGDDGSDWANTGDNTYCVVTAIDTDSTAVLDGFIITGGYSTVWGLGGGISVSGGLTVRDCLFLRNRASYGGGMYCSSWSRPTIIDCHFEENKAGWGSAIHCSDHSGPDITRCVVTGNFGDAGIDCHNTSTPTITSCVISDGVTCRAGSSLRITNCVFPSSHGAINASQTTLRISNCMFQGRIYCGWGCTLRLTNSICWGSSWYTPKIYLSHHPAFVDSWVIAGCNVQGGRQTLQVEDLSALDWSDTNTDVNPLLTPDGHLRASSPCVDAGLRADGPSTDRNGEARPDRAGVDIGPDEFVDADGDALPDWWENRYFGSPTRADSESDPDADGLTNLKEYERYSSHPNTPPYYVDGASGDDSYDGLSPTVGAEHGPKRTIQAAIDAAHDGDTVVVLPGTYAGDGNKNLDFSDKSLIVRSKGGSTATTIDCEGQGSALRHYRDTALNLVALEGFTITDGVLYGYFKLKIRDCVLSGDEIRRSFRTSESYPTIDQLATGSVSVSRSTVDLQGDLSLDVGASYLGASWFHGPGAITLTQGTTIEIRPYREYAWTTPYGETVIRTDINGPGDIEIDADAELIIGGSAVVDLERQPGDDCNDAVGGRIIVNGSLVARDCATIQNTTICVKEANFQGANIIQNNNINLLEASAGYGGEFFVEGSATIRDNAIVSEGDRYLDLDPDADSPNHPTITNNHIIVIIKQGTLGSEGTLLELRARDYDAGTGTNPSGLSGAFRTASSMEFPSDLAKNWVLEELRIDPNAKVNLTNRQGFVYQDDANYPETVYVKQLKLCENAVLNTGLQTLYYRTLVDQNDAEIIRDPNQPNGPFANGSRIIDVPMMGFSLSIIAMEDITEFEIRVRKRITDPRDFDPNEPHTPLPKGYIERIDHQTHGGTMEMGTHEPNDPNNTSSASSVAAVGAFARAAEDEITVAFEYLFRQDPSGDAYLTVYLCDRHETDANAVAVAHVYPPAFDRAGAVGSDEFAVFHATMPRGDFNFTRGTYVKIELHGEDAVCWIDNWDPYITCEDQECANIDGREGVSEADYLLLLVAATGQELPSQWCADVTGDGYLDITDLLSWDAFFSDALNLCPSESPAPVGGPARSKGGPSFSLTNSVGGGNVIVIAGKSGDPGDYQYDVLYTLDPNGGYAEDKRFPNCPVVGQCDTGNGRLLLDDAGTLYQVHGVQGVVQRDTGTAIIGPDHTLTYNEDPNFGDSTVWVGIADEEGLPLTDAVFDRRDSTYVYVVPVLVHRPGGAGDLYKAVAKLEILGDPNDGNYDLVGLYGKDPNAEPNQSIDPLNGSVTLETDVWQVREVDVDGYGNVFALSAQAWNENDWVVMYDEALGNGSEVRVLLKDVLGTSLEAPTALHVSSDDTTLWLASAKNAPDANETAVYRFTIVRSGTTATGLTSAGSVEITNMRHVTSITEDPATGTLYVMGVMAPTFDPEAGNPEADTPIFTWPTLAVVPDGEPGPVAATEISSEDPNHDLALPLSAVFVPACMGYRLTVIFDGTDGTVTVDPNLGCYAPNAPVMLTAEPFGNKQFKKWKVWDAYDANVTVIDTNNPITIDMVADRQVKASFKCGGGGLEPFGGIVLLVLGVLVVIRRLM